MSATPGHDVSTARGSGRGLAVTCDREGRITTVFDDRLPLSTPAVAGGLLQDLVDEQSREKLAAFLGEIGDVGSAFDWELDVSGPDTSYTVTAAGASQGTSCFIILATTRADASRMLEQFFSANNELVNTVRSLQKRLSTTARPSPAEDRESFSELMRLNNDLVNLQREMTKKNAELANSRRLVQSIVDTTPDVIYIFDLVQERTIYTNRGYERILGYSARELRELGDNIYETLLDPDDARSREEHLERIANARDGEALDWEYRMRSVDDRWLWLRSRETVFERDGRGRPVQVLGSAQDITAQRAAEERLVTMTIVDELTGLYNRRGLETLGQQSAAQAVRLGTSIGVVFADLDGLKQINDTIGHNAGDEALAAAAHILRSESRAADLVARIGGDEFVVLAVPGDEPGVERLRERFYSAFDRFNAEESRPYRLEISIGYALCDSPGTCQMDDILDEADQRMYEEKRKRRESRDD